MAFKLGDEVRVIESCCGFPVGYVGKITRVGNYDYTVDNQYYYCNNQIELINKVDNKQNCMQKLNSMLKRLLSPDSQALYKAGFIDGDLKLTSRGQEELSGIVFEANKTELVRLAQEQIVEDKEDK